MNEDLEHRRTQPLRMPVDWTPPQAAYSAALEDVTTIAYYAIQSPAGWEGEDHPETVVFRAWIQRMLDHVDAPDASEFGAYTDAQGHHTWLAILHWNGRTERFERWAASDPHVEYWSHEDRERGASGVFREVFHASDLRLESMYSAPDIAAGVGAGCPVRTGPIQRHAYWGGMRDRLPISAVDPLTAPEDADVTPEPAPGLPPGDAGEAGAAGAAGAAGEAGEAGEPVVEDLRRGPGRRIALAGRPGLAVIHSGQHLEQMDEAQTAHYDRRILPALTGGMRFLRDHPAETGCYSCRFVQETDAQGHAIPRTFGLASFASLGRLEDWAEHHPTHLRIFTNFFAMAEEFGDDLALRLWHQVSVPHVDAQSFEYVNCHPRTGVLPYPDFGEVAATSEPAPSAV